MTVELSLRFKLHDYTNQLVSLWHSRDALWLYYFALPEYNISTPILEPDLLVVKVASYTSL